MSGVYPQRAGVYQRQAPQSQPSAVDDGQDYIIPDGFPGEIRDGIIYLPGDQETVAHSVITHLEYISTTSAFCRYITFEAVNANVDVHNVSNLVEESLRGTDLGAKTKIDMVSDSQISFKCPRSRAEVMMINLFADVMQQTIAGRPGLRVERNVNINES